MNGTIILDLMEEAVRLSEMTGVSDEEAYAYVMAEDSFYDEKGLNDYGDGKFVKPESNVIDVSEMLLYITLKTGLEMHVCEILEKAEMVYFSEIGIM